MSLFNSLDSPMITPNRIATMQIFERSNNFANEVTLISINLQIPTAFSQVSVSIQGKYGALLKNYTSVSVISGSLPTAVKQTIRDEKKEILLELNGLTSQSINISIGGINPLLVPKSA